ncbi:MAG: ATP-binding protein [Clostridia bacterium]|nr:ATP-binding protein [Clostridia bacterium]
MKKIQRDIYLNRLIDSKENGLIKIVTGIRRCGKSYLLDPLYTDYLRSKGVNNDHIIKLELDKNVNEKYRNPALLTEYIESLIIDDDMYYVILDEIQLVKDFEGVLNGFLYKKNMDIYVTGSNSKFLSKDIITEFRGRGCQIHVYPFSYREFYDSYEKDKTKALDEYLRYGGMPLSIMQNTDEDKANYLKDLFKETYIRDIIDRNRIEREDILNILIDILASDVGSLTNVQKIYDTFVSNGEKEISKVTIDSYINHILDSFIVSKASRYDVKGRKYISTPSKYYFTDIGLRNARLNFRQQEKTHIMENVIYNELLVRRFNVDVGVVPIVETIDGNKVKKKIEIDFVCNRGDNTYYIQSCFSLDDHEKTIIESRPLNSVKDNFKKIIVVYKETKRWITDDGIEIIPFEEFLLEDFI